MQNPTLFGTAKIVQTKLGAKRNYIAVSLVQSQLLATLSILRKPHFINHIQQFEQVQ